MTKKGRVDHFKPPPITEPGVRPRDLCERFGIEAVCEMTVEGVALYEIARHIGVRPAVLTHWVEQSTDRSIRFREARRQSARTWDDLAEHFIKSAEDQFELNKAKELAHHYRWRAKAIAPREYGDKVTQEVTGVNGAPLQLVSAGLKVLNDSELQQLQELLAKADKG